MFPNNTSTAWAYRWCIVNVENKKIIVTCSEKHHCQLLLEDFDKPWKYEIEYLRRYM